MVVYALNLDKLIGVNQLIDYLLGKSYLSQESSWPTERYTCLKRLLELLNSSKWKELQGMLGIDLREQLEVLIGRNIDEVWVEGHINNPYLNSLVQAYNERLIGVNEVERLKITTLIIKGLFDSY